MKPPGGRSKERGQATVEGDWGATTVSGKFVAAMEEALGLSITPSARRSTSIKDFAVNEWHCRSAPPSTQRYLRSACPISPGRLRTRPRPAAKPLRPTRGEPAQARGRPARRRSEEHTSELQSRE